jgi:murein L,D-transpeptidase YcbB/YkuD
MGQGVTPTAPAGASRAFAILVLLARLTLWLGAAGPAAAQDDNWMRWPGTAYASQSDPSGKAFVREWEATPPKGFPTLSPANIAPTKAAIVRYSTLAAQGGWVALPEVQLQSGMNHPAVALLRRRLQLSGDLKDDDGTSQSFDYYVDKAVRRYQASNGLAPTGIVDKHTLAALNVPTASRLHQLQTNLTRLNDLVRSAGKKYVVVNIPAAQIEAVENGLVVSRHSGVVGKPDRPTPLLKSTIHQLNFNAVWHLPPTVIDKDLIPKGRDMARRGENVLVKYHIDAYGGDGKKLDPNKINWNAATAKNLTYQQQPGPENPLGFVKINFDNSYSVYMHDTPSQSLFGQNFRATSSGCVRVQGIEHLAAWLTADQGWRPEHIQQMKQTGERLDVKLKKPIPLYFVYITAWATEDGVVQFRRDLYQKDGVGAVASAY